MTVNNLTQDQTFPHKSPSTLIRMPTSIPSFVCVMSHVSTLSDSVTQLVAGSIGDKSGSFSRQLNQSKFLAVVINTHEDRRSPLILLHTLLLLFSTCSSCTSTITAFRIMWYLSHKWIKYDALKCDKFTEMFLGFLFIQNSGK